MRDSRNTILEWLQKQPQSDLVPLHVIRNQTGFNTGVCLSVLRALVLAGSVQTEMGLHGQTLYRAKEHELLFEFDELTEVMRDSNWD